MKAIRLLAVAVLILIAVYFVIRGLASACTGAACDAYIPISVLFVAAGTLLELQLALVVLAYSFLTRPQARA